MKRKRKKKKKVFDNDMEKNLIHICLLQKKSFIHACMTSSHPPGDCPSHQLLPNCYMKLLPHEISWLYLRWSKGHRFDQWKKKILNFFYLSFMKFPHKMHWIWPKYSIWPKIFNMTTKFCSKTYKCEFVAVEALSTLFQHYCLALCASW